MDLVRGQDLWTTAGPDPAKPIAAATPSLSIGRWRRHRTPCSESFLGASRCPIALSWGHPPRAAARGRLPVQRPATAAATWPQRPRHDAHRPEMRAKPAKLEPVRSGARRIRWPPRLARLLGRVPDETVARRSGLHPHTVAVERRRRGIPPSSPRRPRVRWTAAMIALLGTAVDREVAAELGLPVHCVMRQRRFLGIAAVGRSIAHGRHFWTPRRVALLGTAPDGEIARRLKLAVSTVCHRRRVLGIAPFTPAATGPRWTRAMLRLLGTLADREVAERFGIPLRTVRAKRWRRGTPARPGRRLKIARTADLARLLRRLNEEVRRATGLSTMTVYRLRRELGVPNPPRPSVWTPAALARLGTVPDAELARELGVGAAYVAQRRQRLGLLRHRRWTPQEERQLGIAPNRHLAERLGRSLGAVELRRRLLARRALRPGAP
jgi:hypothetical protein